MVQLFSSDSTGQSLSKNCHDDLCEHKKEPIDSTDCIIHFGMPKTGSTAIQSSLSEYLNDKKYHFININNPNSSKNVKIAFAEQLETSKIFRQQSRQLNIQVLKQIKTTFLTALNKQLIYAKQHQKTAIISGETMISLSLNEMREFRRYIVERCPKITAVIYIRTPKSLIESRFQQKLKGGWIAHEKANIRRVCPDYYARLATLERVFSQDSLHYWKYDRSQLRNGCVVQDFCHRLGIHFMPEKVISENQGLSIPAISLLHIYQGYYPHGKVFNLNRNHPLIEKLQSLQGPKLRFHSCLIRPILEQQQQDIQWMEGKLGHSLSEHLSRDDGFAIRDLNELLNVNQETIKWLREQIDLPFVGNAGYTLEQVAEWMHHLFLQLTPKAQLKILENKSLQPIQKTSPHRLEEKYQQFKHQQVFKDFLIPYISSERKRIITQDEFGHTDDVLEKFFIAAPFAGLDWQQSKNFPIIKLQDSLVYKNTLFSERYIYKGVINYPLGSVTEVLKNKIKKRQFKFEPINFFGFKYWDDVSNSAVISRSLVESEFPQQVLYVNSSAAAKNFAHFSFELLLQLAYVNYLRGQQVAITPLLGRPFKYPMMEYLFKFLFGAEYIALNPNKVYRFKRIYVAKPISSFFSQDPFPLFTQDIIDYFKSQLHQHFDPTNQPSKRKIFITRKDGVTEKNGLKRSYSNQDQLEILLKREGFEFITITEYSPKEIIQIFSQAHTIVGAHGAGLMNMMFAKDHSKVLELCLPDRPSNKTPKCNRRFIKQYGMDCYQVPVMEANRRELDLKVLEKILGDET